MSQKTFVKEISLVLVIKLMLLFAVWFFFFKPTAQKSIDPKVPFSSKLENKQL